MQIGHVVVRRPQHIDARNSIAARILDRRFATRLVARVACTHTRMSVHYRGIACPEALCPRACKLRRWLAGAILLSAVRGTPIRYVSRTLKSAPIYQMEISHENRNEIVRVYAPRAFHVSSPHAEMRVLVRRTRLYIVESAVHDYLIATVIVIFHISDT